MSNEASSHERVQSASFLSSIDCARSFFTRARAVVVVVVVETTRVKEKTPRRSRETGVRFVSFGRAARGNSSHFNCAVGDG
jgi:hypothetical protein